MRVLGISGSLRGDSHNGRLLRAAAALLPPEAEFVPFDGLKAIQPFDEDDELEPGPAVQAWRKAGTLKNAIDWASRPFATAALRNKPAATIGASTGMFGAVWAQAELRKSLAAAGARVIDRELPIGEADGAFTADGRLGEHDQELALGEILAELLAEADARVNA
jgi:chromate reductase